MGIASGLLEDTIDSCIVPVTITYPSIVKGYYVAGDVDRAFSVLEVMKSEVIFVPDVVLLNSFLEVCAKQYRVNEALRALVTKSAGLSPSNYTLGAPGNTWGTLGR